MQGSRVVAVGDRRTMDMLYAGQSKLSVHERSDYEVAVVVAGQVGRMVVEGQVERMVVEALVERMVVEGRAGRMVVADLVVVVGQGRSRRRRLRNRSHRQR